DVRRLGGCLPSTDRLGRETLAASSPPDFSGSGTIRPMPDPKSLLTAVQEVLFREWDPIGVNDNESCRDEYDSYAPTICRWLLKGVDEEKLATHLGELQRVSMGLSSIDDEANRRVARRLIALQDTAPR